MLFQEVIPDTSRYMVAGYVIAIVAMLGYALSLYLRERRLLRDMQELEDLIPQQEPAV